MKTMNDEDISRKIVKLFHKYTRSKAIYSKDLRRKHDLSVVQLLCLHCLFDNGRMPMSGIANNIRVNRSTLTRTIDHLERKGLLERCRVSGDRRVILIALTEKGRSLVDNSPSVVHKKIARKINMLSETERIEISRFLEFLDHLIEFEYGDQDTARAPDIQSAENA